MGYEAHPIANFKEENLHDFGLTVWTVTGLVEKQEQWTRRYEDPTFSQQNPLRLRSVPLVLHASTLPGDPRTGPALPPDL